jgi:pyruvate ferredoxin oxidoreductase delta subunit
MKRPKVQPFTRPKHIDELPQGTCSAAGHLVDTNASWRTQTPKLEPELCTCCLQCYLMCPEGVIAPVEGGITIDYDYCKGCGICARTCKKHAIKMSEGGGV